MANPLKILIGVGALAGGLLVLAWPSIQSWRAERQAEAAFGLELHRIDLELVDQRLITRGGAMDDEAAVRWRYAKVHELLRKHSESKAPRFRARTQLLLGVYDRSTALATEVERAALTALDVQSIHPAVYDDPVETRRVLDRIAKLREFVAGLRVRVETDHEWARRELAASELAPDKRAEVWATAEQAYLMLDKSVISAERLAPTLAALEATIAYLDQNRGRYFTYTGGAVVFTDSVKQKQWTALREALKR